MSRSCGSDQSAAHLVQHHVAAVPVVADLAVEEEATVLDNEVLGRVVVDALDVQAHAAQLQVAHAQVGPTSE